MRWCLALALCVFAMGCVFMRPQIVDFSDASKNHRSDDYPATFETWTRHAKLVEDVGTVIEVWATFKSWDFRQAYVAKYAHAYDLASSERDEVAKSQKEAAQAVYEIHLVAQSTTEKWNDLERKNSPWRTTLVDGTGAELAPTSIRVEKLPEVYESEFFPMRTPFSRTYTLRFVRPESASDSFAGPATGRLILRIASPMGKVEVSWEAKSSSP